VAKTTLNAVLMMHFPSVAKQSTGELSLVITEGNRLVRNRSGKLVADRFDGNCGEVTDQ
jgi:hypothetical protein